MARGVWLDRSEAENTTLLELLDRLSPVARQLGCEAELAGVEAIIDHGASYQRQRQVAQASGGDLSAVVAALTSELRESLAEQA